MNIATLLRNQATARPDATALIDARGPSVRRLTFAELDDASARVAGFLTAGLGLKAGARVLVLQPMSADLYIILAALFRAGLTAVFLDPGAGVAHVDQCCRMIPPDALIGIPKAHLLRLVSPALRAIPRAVSTGGWLPFSTRFDQYRGFAPAPEAAVDPKTPALLTFTSGSTGAPKAAVRSHGFLLAQHRALQAVLPPEAGDVHLSTMPVVLLTALASGATAVIPGIDLARPGRVDGAKALRQITTFGVTTISASPAFLERLVRAAGAMPGAAAGATASAEAPLHVRRIATGGAPVFPGLLRGLQRLAPGARLLPVYGSTEAEPIACTDASAITEQDWAAMQNGAGLLAGPPVADLDLLILPDRWGEPVAPLSEAALRESALPSGAPGEIVVSGPHVLQGYYQGQGDAQAKIRTESGVWHRTGDAGYLDPHGRLWLLGRCAARVTDTHGTLYPFAVEAAASCCAWVARSALVAQGGNRLLVVEPLRPPAPAEVEELRGQLAWAAIDEVRLVRQIPTDRRHNAKVDYPRLYRLLGMPGR
jgi:olefin beta-lactone synthetase